ncbi:VOC family protein [Devosia sp.]|uniref:VOC family protein n=1 Tax=Devosia sp. TaxID=1871048 RepID=UPI0035AFE441
MQLGAFSISLAVRDIAASRDFYTKLGFRELGGNIEQNWLILTNGSATIGLFQGMFEHNILTFNPGWNADATPFDPFDDVRDIQKRLEAEGIAIVTRADPASSGPAHFVIRDPDGNEILVDQHR